jgi:hypothetical protein
MSPITASSFWNEGISQDLGCRDQCRLPKYAVHVNGLLIAGQLSALSCPPKLNFPQEREVAMQRSSFALLEFDPELNKLIKGKQLRDGLSAVANRRVALDRQRQNDQPGAPDC